MSRRILITNDDGIGADGLRKLAEIARGFGEVTIVAPDTQRSASSHHCVFNRPLTLKAFSFGLRGVEAFTLDGTPADCARVGIFAGSDRKPDLVLSGINHGYNISSDIQYSGTVGAALEAAFLGVRAITSRGDEGAIRRGALLGLLYMGIGVALYALLTHQRLSWMGYLIDALMGVAAGGLSGMALSSLRGK